MKAFGESTAANGITGPRGGKLDKDIFALIDLAAPTGTTLKDQEYKITVADEKWDGNDDGDVGNNFKVTKGTVATNVLPDDGSNKFTPDGTSDYFLHIWGEEDKDAQYSVILELV